MREIFSEQRTVPEQFPPSKVSAVIPTSERFDPVIPRRVKLEGALIWSAVNVCEDAATKVSPEPVMAQLIVWAVPQESVSPPVLSPVNPSRFKSGTRNSSPRPVGLYPAGSFI